MSKLTVALVYPPFGPSALPSLGLGLLSARIKQAGYTCKTFYWNLEFAQAIPLPTLADRIRGYDDLTQMTWYPFNEWIFEGLCYSDISDNVRDAEAVTALIRLSEHLYGTLVGVDEILALRQRARDLVYEFANNLADYDVIGIATTFYQNLPALALAREVKHRWPSKLVVLGGANTDGPMGRSLLSLFPAIDYVFSGETDYTFIDFLIALETNSSLDRIPGLHFRRINARDDVVSGPPSLLTYDLTNLPFPDYDDYVKTRQRLGLDSLRPLVISLETSRGCWWGEKNHCTFCGLNANGMIYRSKPVDQVKAEVSEIRARYQPKFIFMSDNILPRDYFDTVLDWARKEKLGLQFFYEIKSNVTREEVQRLAEAGVSAVQPGIESLSTPILRLMRKGVTAAQNVAFLKYAREYGIHVAYNILVGFPNEPLDAYDNFIQQIPHLVHLSPPTGIPIVEYHRFSPYHSDPERFGITLEPNPSYQLLYPFDKENLADIAYRFVRTDVRGGIPEMPYFGILQQAITSWQSRKDGDYPSLLWRQIDKNIEVLDSRNGKLTIFRLGGMAAEIFRLLDEPRGINGLIRSVTEHNDESENSGDFSVLAQLAAGGAVPIYFNRQTFLSEPGACLSLLYEAGLVFRDTVEDHALYVALPLAYDTPPRHRDWLDTGI
jgi:ribosomal peptide maturation radical SAM protein 1